MNAPFSKPSTRPQPDREQIATVAYHLYVEYGSRDGNDLEHWLRAEELLTECLVGQQEETAAVSTPFPVGGPVSRPVRKSNRAPVPVPASRFQRTPAPRQPALSRLPVGPAVAAAV